MASKKGYIPLEGLKELVDGLNQLFDILFSQEEIVVRSISIETGRQKTLDDKIVFNASATVSLESEDIQDYYSRALRDAGFKVNCREAFIEFVVSFKPLFETAKPKK